MSGNEVLLERIRNLLARTEDRGATPAEAETAARMAAALMRKHGIQHADLRIDDQGTVDVGVNDVTEVREETIFRTPGWAAIAALAAAKACGASVYKHGGRLRFVGAFGDAAAALEIFRWMLRRVEADLARYKRRGRDEEAGSFEIRYGARQTGGQFRYGWAQGVLAAVKAEIEARVDETETRTSSSGALVVVHSNQLATAKAAAIRAFLAPLGLVRRTSRGYSGGAVDAGFAAGRSTSIGNWRAQLR